MDIFPKKAISINARIVETPHWGVLRLGNRVLIPGDRFTYQDVVLGKLSYSQNKIIDSEETEIEDSFKFILFDSLNNPVTKSSFVACMAEQADLTPDDGIFEFKITIDLGEKPQVADFERMITLYDYHSAVISAAMIGSTSSIGSKDLIYQVVEDPQYGYISVSGQKTAMFSHQDVVNGLVEYVSTESGPISEEVNFRLCTMNNRCTDFAIKFNIQPRFRHLNDNIIYAAVGKPFSLDLEASVANVLWELVGGTETPPFGTLGTMPYDVIEWTSYNPYSGNPTNDPEIGVGYELLPEYRNVVDAIQWGGGLPIGIHVSKSGRLSTANTNVNTPGQQLWAMPANPSTYKFKLKAINPYTGEEIIRDYELRVTATGRGPNGELSARTD